jgi:hypothetical protein
VADNAENARALTLAMLEAGREPLWALLITSWYFGDRGREAALALLEQQGIDPPVEDAL